MPAWGPPNSLSPEKVTMSAPDSRLCFADGSPISHFGGPFSNQGHAESIKPDPISAIMGIPKSVMSEISVVSVKPTIR